MPSQPIIDPGLPLCDLHRHLDGSVRLQTILDLAEAHAIPLPARSIDALRPFVQITRPSEGLMEFIGKFRYMGAVLVDADACRRIAFENVEDAAREGIDYIELRFSPWFMAENHGLDARAVGRPDRESRCDRRLPRPDSRGPGGLADVRAAGRGE